MRCLVAQHDPITACLLLRALQSRHSATVDIAPDGEEVLNLCKAAEYDLLILDLQLAKLPGLTVLHQLREAGVEAPILVVTECDRPDDLTEALYAGADAFLPNTVHLDELHARIRALLRRHAVRLLEAHTSVEIDGVRHGAGGVRKRLSPAIVNTMVSRLRHKIDNNFGTKLIHTIRGVGYILQNSSPR